MSGLGFRKMAIMNEALLAKQAWKFLPCPNSLVVSIMMSKYGKGNHFLEIEEKPNSSWACKSVLVGNEVLTKGIDMQIWSGNSIQLLTPSDDYMSVNQLII